MLECEIDHLPDNPSAPRLIRRIRDSDDLAQLDAGDQCPIRAAIERGRQHHQFAPEFGLIQ